MAGDYDRLKAGDFAVLVERELEAAPRRLVPRVKGLWSAVGVASRRVVRPAASSANDGPAASDLGHVEIHALALCILEQELAIASMQPHEVALAHHIHDQR